MRKAATPIPFVGSQLGEARHACAFFNSDMDWALEHGSHVDGLVESRLNDLWRRHNDAAICTYNLVKFGGARGSTSCGHTQ